jgi:hypothetical protein
MLLKLALCEALHLTFSYKYWRDKKSSCPVYFVDILLKVGSLTKPLSPACIYNLLDVVRFHCHII